MTGQAGARTARAASRSYGDAADECVLTVDADLVARAADDRAAGVAVDPEPEARRGGVETGEGEVRGGEEAPKVVAGVGIGLGERDEGHGGHFSPGLEGSAASEIAWFVGPRG
jgi:hypothetical protein